MVDSTCRLALGSAGEARERGCDLGQGGVRVEVMCGLGGNVGEVKGGGCGDGGRCAHHAGGRAETPDWRA